MRKQNFYFLVQLTERGVLNPLNEKRKTTFDRGKKKRKKKGDEKQEEIKLTSTKHLPQRGDGDRIADIKNKPHPFMNSSAMIISTRLIWRLCT